MLSESDWQALRAVEPDAVGWLKSQISQRLGTDGRQEPKPSAPPETPASPWNDDLY